MANIFRKKDAYIDRVNRSTFDLSFVNNLTMKFGAITPVCLLPASFGDSFQINARFNLQLLPTVFPIQTQLYVRLHFVYVRTRTIWEDWMSFFGGDETVTPPWMNVLSEGNTPERKSQFNIPDDSQPEHINRNRIYVKNIRNTKIITLITDRGATPIISYKNLRQRKFRNSPSIKIKQSSIRRTLYLSTRENRACNNRI